MPGSYPAPEILANNALDTLKQAYEERQTPNVGSLILTAYDTIARLKQEITARRDDDLMDRYELNEFNSAV